MNRMREDEFEGRPELVRKRARALVLQRAAAGLVAFFILASLSLLVYNALISLSTRDALLDCTTPTGRCYTDGQKRTGGIVQSILDAYRLNEVATRRVVVVAAACAADPVNTTVDDIQRCVNAELNQNGDR